MSQGFASGFGPGLQLGLQATNAREQRRIQEQQIRQQAQLAALRDALMRDQMAQRSDYQTRSLEAQGQRAQETRRHNEAMEGFRNDSNEIAMAGIQQRNSAAIDKANQRQATSRDNAQYIAGELDAPGIGQGYMGSDHSPEAWDRTLGQAVGAQSRYEGMTPEAQAPFLSDAKYLQRQQLMHDMKVQSAHTLLSKLPPSARNNPSIIAQIESQVAGFRVPGLQSPMDQLRGQQQARMQADAAYKGYQGAKSEHAESTRALKAGEAKYKEDIAIGSAKDATPEQRGKFNEAMRLLKPMREAEALSKQRRADAFKDMMAAQRQMFDAASMRPGVPGNPAQENRARQAAPGSSTTPPPPEQSISHEQATDQAVKELGPTAPRDQLLKRAMEIMQQGAGRGGGGEAFGPYDDTRLYPDDGLDDEDVDPFTDFEFDDEAIGAMQ